MVSRSRAILRPDPAGTQRATRVEIFDAFHHKSLPLTAATAVGGSTADELRRWLRAVEPKPELLVTDQATNVHMLGATTGPQIASELRWFDGLRKRLAATRAASDPTLARTLDDLQMHEQLQKLRATAAKSGKPHGSPLDQLLRNLELATIEAHHVALQQLAKQTDRQATRARDVGDAKAAERYRALLEALAAPRPQAAAMAFPGSPIVGHPAFAPVGWQVAEQKVAQPAVPDNGK